MATPYEVCDGVTGAFCDAAGAVVGGVGSSVFDAMFVALGAAFVASAQDVVSATLAALDTSTRVDLSASWFSRNLGVLAAVSLPVVVGLFVVQVIGSVLRREPGGLVRAVVGVGKATVGAAVAIAGTKVALTATDAICAAIAQSAGTSVAGAARRFLDLTWLAGPGTGPVLQMLLASAVMVGVVLLWGVLLFRKAAILLVAVFAPIAFAGSAWDQTRVWTRRWIETVIALVFCKVVIVVVFVLGAAAFGSTGSTGLWGVSGVGDAVLGCDRGPAAVGVGGLRPVDDVPVRALVGDGGRHGAASPDGRHPDPGRGHRRGPVGEVRRSECGDHDARGRGHGRGRCPDCCCGNRRPAGCSCGCRGRGGGCAVSDAGVRFGRLERRGLLLGLSGEQVFLCGLALAVVVIAEYTSGLPGVIAAAPFWALTLAGALVPVRGRPVVQWLPIWVGFLGRRVRGVARQHVDPTTGLVAPGLTRRLC